MKKKHGLFWFLLICLLLLLFSAVFRNVKEPFSVPTVYVVPSSGLCNRLRALICAELYTKKFGYHLKVLYFPAINNPVHFSDLFTYPFEFQSEIPQNVKIVYTSTMANHGRFKDIINNENSNALMIDKHFIENPISESVLFITNQNLCDGSTEEYKAIQRAILDSTKPSITEGVRMFFQTHRKPINVAVHIRSVDIVEGEKKEVIAQESVEDRFFPRMDELNSLDVAFFICTDDEENFAKVQQRYSNAYMLPRTSYDRSEKEAIFEAVADLYLMNLCEKFIGTPGSSFTGFIQNLKS